MERSLINYLQLYRQIPEEDQAHIEAAFELQHYKEGDTLFASGHKCRKFFFICNGVLRIVVQNDGGKEVTHFFLKENSFCTILHSFHSNAIADESIEAACNASVLAISKAGLLALYKQVPYLEGIIDQVTRQALIDKIQTRTAYLGADAATRYKLFMMRQPDIALRVSQSDIASYLDITPQSLSRIRKNIR